MDKWTPIPILTSIDQAGPDYRAWLVDIWGVMHDGERAAEGAVRACRRFRATGGVALLISNAPRPWDSVAAQLDGIGVPRDAYDAILSSGDLTRALVRERPEARVFHLGPERDRPVFEGLNVDFVEEDDATLVVCTGLFDDETETPDDYAEMLERLAARAVPMICANPDLKVERGSRLVWCAGGLAAPYAALGGAVIYAGKPYAPIYELALERLAEIAGAVVSKERVLAIGDGVNTDIKGAANAGIDSVFVASGLHVTGFGDGLDSVEVERLFAGIKRPIAAMRRLA